MDVIKRNLLCLCLCLSFAAMADGSHSKSDFNKAYKAYQSALKDQDLNKGLITAEKALAIGLELFGADSETAAVLTFNHAQMFYLKHKTYSRGDKDIFEKSEALFSHTLDMYKSAYGEESLELIDPLMSLGMLYKQNLHERVKGTRIFNHALKIAKEHKEAPALLYADLSLEVGRALVQDSTYFRKAQRYLKSAYQQYTDALPADDFRVIDSAFWYGKFNYFNGRYEKAEKLFLFVVNAYEKANRASHEKALTSNAFLVRLYEKMGQSDKATQYCQAIGQAKPWSGEQEQTPVFILEPKWPMKALRTAKEGVIRVSFMVDKNGFTKDFEVLNLSEDNKIFTKSATDAISKWRFAPKYENGEAVEARTTYTMEFRLE